MTDLVIKEVKTPQEMEQFIHFPMELYKNNKNYVPSLINDERQIWDPSQNAALNYSEAQLFLAEQNQKIVGRIAVMLNRKEGQEMNIHKIRFGWLDFIDDLNVSKALLQQAINFAKNHNIQKIEGPMGFTNLDKAGMLTMGFDKLATMIGIYNFDYYPKHMEHHGLVKDKEWVEFEMKFPEVLPDKVVKFNELIKQKYHLNVLEFKNKKEILPYVEPMFKLLDETYKTLSTYTPISKEQIKTYKEKYFGLIHKDYIVCVENDQKELIAFAITMPSYSKALQKSKGKLWPFGWWHFLQAGRKNDRANFYLIGVHPNFQKKGVTSVIFTEIHKIFSKKGVKYLETNPELEENKNIQVLWHDYNPVNHKRRRTYSTTVNEFEKII